MRAINSSFALPSTGGDFRYAVRLPSGPSSIRGFFEFGFTLTDISISARSRETRWQASKPSRFLRISLPATDFRPTPPPTLYNNTVIREETPQDHHAIRDLNRIAFAGDFEAELIDRLRAEGLVITSLVAIEDARVAGHILFSILPVETEAGTRRTAALAPMSVLPEFQRRGIGSALVRRGLELCREQGYTIAIVVGHPAYYPRFGFSAELAKPLAAPFSGDAFMAAELTPGALKGVTGAVKYPEAFGLEI